MIQNLSITAVVENTAGEYDFLGEWGLAFWIEADSRRLLFDTGQGRTLFENARKLGVDPAAAEMLILSHGHTDHSGGIAAVLAAGFRGRLYAHPAALADKYSRHGNSPIEERGVPENALSALHALPVPLVDCTSPVELAPGMLLTGSIPRQTSFEDTGGDFFLDSAGTRIDPLLDDQALLVETPSGWVIVTGCGHSGIINTLLYAAQLTGVSRFHAVVGGLHLYRASEDRIRKTTQALRDFGVQNIAPCHCTGFNAATYLRSELGNRFVPFSAGMQICFPG